MTSPEDAIRARRRLTNKLIAAHEAGRLRPFLDPQVKVIAGDGALVTGADAVVSAFEAQFRDPAFVAYARTPDIVELDHAGARGWRLPVRSWFGLAQAGCSIIRRSSTSLRHRLTRWSTSLWANRSFSWVARLKA